LQGDIPWLFLYYPYIQEYIFIPIQYITVEYICYPDIHIIYFDYFFSDKREITFKSLFLVDVEEKSVPVKPQGPGRMRNQGEAVLRIASVTEEDAGRYFCVAENEVGKTRADVSVSITGK
jgi:hypothetical protein